MGGCAALAEGARLCSGGIHDGGVQGGSHIVVAILAAPRVIAVKSSERESCEHLRWTHLEQVQHCTDFNCQVTFPTHKEQEKMGPGLG